MKKKVIGASMLVMFFAGIFVAVGIAAGWREALLTFVGAVFGSTWVMVAIHFLGGE